MDPLPVPLGPATQPCQSFWRRKALDEGDQRDRAKRICQEATRVLRIERRIGEWASDMSSSSVLTEGYANKNNSAQVDRY